MQSSDMKNMVVLKNLPSNMIEEAIIIFKERQRVKELIDKSNHINFSENEFKSKEYILKEAEMLVTDYINKIEEKKKIDKEEMSIRKKYQILKKYSIVSTAILIISLIINFI